MFPKYHSTCIYRSQFWSLKVDESSRRAYVLTSAREGRIRPWIETVLIGASFQPQCSPSRGMPHRPDLGSSFPLTARVSPRFFPSRRRCVVHSGASHYLLRYRRALDRGCHTESQRFVAAPSAFYSRDAAGGFNGRRRRDHTERRVKSRVR